MSDDLTPAVLKGELVRRPDAQLALLGDDPLGLIDLPTAEFNVRVSQFTSDTAPFIKQFKRAVGIACWAARHHYPETGGAYAKWLNDIGEALGFSNDTLKRWRDRVEMTDKLPMPDKPRRTGRPKDTKPRLPQNVKVASAESITVNPPLAAGSSKTAPESPSSAAGDPEPPIPGSPAAPISPSEASAGLDGDAGSAARPADPAPSSDPTGHGDAGEPRTSAPFSDLETPDQAGSPSPQQPEPTSAGSGASASNGTGADRASSAGRVAAGPSRGKQMGDSTHGSADGNGRGGTGRLTRGPDQPSVPNPVPACPASPDVLTVPKKASDATTDQINAVLNWVGHLPERRMYNVDGYALSACRRTANSEQSRRDELTRQRITPPVKERSTDVTPIPKLRDKHGKENVRR